MKQKTGSRHVPVPSVDPLQNVLDAAAHARELADAPGFIQRCGAIDLLELHLGESSDPETTDLAGCVSALRQEALALHRDLLTRNAALVEGLRQDIASGRCLRGDLVNELQRYCAGPPPRGTDGNLEYDSLDVLVAGLLGTDLLPDDDPAEAVPDMFAYQPTPARIILEIVRQTHLSPDDVFVDIGSGLGVVPILVSMLSGAAAIGIEVQPRYCRHAEESVRRLNLSNVRFLFQDARQADLSMGTVFYMYTPFKGAMLQQVLDRLHAEGRRRRIRLCTYGPILSEAVERATLPSFERRPLPKGPLAVFESGG